MVGKDMKKGTAREILSSLMWRKDRDMGLVKVGYVHRGAPRDMAEISGKDIISMSELFFRISKNSEEVQIPFHRVRTITYDGRLVFSRNRDGK